MEVYKFKKGDRVKVVSLGQAYHDDGVKIGMTGTVIEDCSKRPWVEFDEEINTVHTYCGSKKGRTMCMWENEIEKADIKDKNTINIVAGIINSTGKMLYWKNEKLDLEIGDYAIVENTNGYDLIKVIGIVKTDKNSAGRFSNTKYENMKECVSKIIIDKEN